MNSDAANGRRARRRNVNASVPVTDAIADKPIGSIGNLSRTGLMLISSQPLHDDGVYQLSFKLPDADGRTRTLEIGMQQQWSDTPATPGQYWTGLRFIDVSDDDDAVLEDWLEGDD